MALSILVVESDQRAQDGLVWGLAQFGHAVRMVSDGPSAQALLGKAAFDALVLDWPLPTPEIAWDGLFVLRQLREDGVMLPVLVHGALGRTLPKVEALDAGADDYLVKPADPLEMEARLRALVRARRFGSAPKDTVAIGDIVVSPSRLLAWRGGRPLSLSQTEFRLLLELARAGGAIVSKPALIAQVWGEGFVPATNIVEAHIRHLRIKLTRHGADPIATVRGMGYCLRA